MDEHGTETLLVEDRTDWTPHTRWRPDRRLGAALLAAAVLFAGVYAAVPDPPRRARVAPARAVYYSGVFTEARSDCSPNPRW